MPYAKYAKKVAKKVGKVVKKRYFRGKGYSRPKVQQMAKDIMYLKGVLNPEKKVYTQNAITIGVGQVSGNNNGFYALDITPTPSQGTTSITRNGNSIKLHSSFIKFMFQHQSSTTSNIRVKIQMVLVKGPPNASVGTFPSAIMYEPNPFVTGNSIYDYNSSQNPDYFGTYQIIREMKFTVRQDQLAGSNTIKSVSMPMKYFRGKGHHVRFAADGSNTVADGQLLLIFTADNGNISSGTASTLGGIANAGTATGLLMSMNLVHYFYDN